MIKPKKTLENIKAYDVDYYKNDWRLKLDANENIYGCPTSILSIIKNIPQEEISHYPVYGELIDKIAQKYDIEKENVLISNGCDEALNVIINSYLDIEDEILIYNPTFSMPKLYAQIIGGKVKTVDYMEKFVFSKEQIKNSISNDTKIIYISTPNNPTGEVARASILEGLIEEFQNILFIIDCTYINFSTCCAFEDYLDLTKKYENVIVTKSFSKDFGIAGLRFGISVANKEIINNLKKVISPYSVNSIALNCAKILINDDKTIEEIKELNSIAKNYLFEELEKQGFKPYKSEANFILCDFFSHCDFYYEKLKKNGVIVRKFSKNSPLSTCLRITVPKLGGIKYIVELLNKKDVLIFSLDGNIFDISNSCIQAIAQTFKHFTNQEISQNEILETKNMGFMNCNWDAVEYLLKKYGYNIEMQDIINVYQNLYFNPEILQNKNYLIDNEKLLISKETFEKLNEKYDLVLFSGRLKDEAKYSLEKFDIDKFFYYYITSDDLPKNMLKPHSKGLEEILEHCPHKTIKFLGDSVDDIISGNKANIETIGVIAPNADYNVMVNNFRHLGIKNIIGDVKNIENFLEELEKEDAKTI